jgi:hypothetical protein
VIAHGFLVLSFVKQLFRYIFCFFWCLHLQSSHYNAVVWGCLLTVVVNAGPGRGGPLSLGESVKVRGVMWLDVLMNGVRVLIYFYFCRGLTAKGVHFKTLSWWPSFRVHWLGWGFCYPAKVQQEVIFFSVWSCSTRVMRKGQADRHSVAVYFCRWNRIRWFFLFLFNFFILKLF